MKQLYDLGIKEDELREITHICPDLLALDDNDIIDNINLLKLFNFTLDDIQNIIVSNPYFLIKPKNSILNLLNYFKELSVVDLTLLFTTYPYLFNKEIYEFEHYINNELNNNKSKEEIINEFLQTPSIIDER